MLLLDQNISYRAIKLLNSEFEGVAHVSRIGISPPVKDREIWDFAKINDLLIVTFDEDFADFSSVFGHPPKVIWLRCGNSSTKSICRILIRKSELIKEFMKDNTLSVLEIQGVN